MKVSKNKNKIRINKKMKVSGVREQCNWAVDIKEDTRCNEHWELCKTNESLASTSETNHCKKMPEKEKKKKNVGAKSNQESRKTPSPGNVY